MCIVSSSFKIPFMDGSSFLENLYQAGKTLDANGAPFQQGQHGVNFEFRVASQVGDGATLRAEGDSRRFGLRGGQIISSDGTSVSEVIRDRIVSLALHLGKG